MKESGLCILMLHDTCAVIFTATGPCCSFTRSLNRWCVIQCRVPLSSAVRGWSPFFRVSLSSGGIRHGRTPEGYRNVVSYRRRRVRRLRKQTSTSCYRYPNSVSAASGAHYYGGEARLTRLSELKLTLTPAFSVDSLLRVFLCPGELKTISSSPSYCQNVRALRLLMSEFV
jgi:hypothetical protein